MESIHEIHLAYFAGLDGVYNVNVRLHRVVGGVSCPFHHNVRRYTPGKGILGKANIEEEEIDDFTKKMEDNHIARLSERVCSPAVGAQYLSLSSNAERVGDHLINVTKTIRSLKQN